MKFQHYLSFHLHLFIYLSMITAHMVHELFGIVHGPVQKSIVCEPAVSRPFVGLDDTP